MHYSNRHPLGFCDGLQQRERPPQCDNDEYGACNSILLSQLVALRLSDNGLQLIFFCLILTWAADLEHILLAGFGKHKLAPRVSPNKTWEGAVGGLLTAFVCAIIINQAYLGIELLHLIFLVIVLDIVSILGDLFESMLKRAVNVKDLAG